MPVLAIDRTKSYARMSQRSFDVQENCELLPFLIATFRSSSRTTVKSYLAHRQVEVNGRVETRFDTPLCGGDRVSVFPGRRSNLLRHPMLRVVHEDDALIVIDKRSGLLSMGTERERRRTAYYILSEHVKRVDPAARIFIVHRLDRDTSGLMMFAKSETVKRTLQENWDGMIRRRTYVAVVEGTLPRETGIVSTYLTENKGYKVFVTNRCEGERAVTHYRVLKAGADRSMLELELETGKKNQIRAHMEYVGHSIVGDRKYGATSDPLGRVALHANRLAFVHPVTGAEMDFTSPAPAAFGALVDKGKDN